MRDKSADGLRVGELVNKFTISVVGSLLLFMHYRTALGGLKRCGSTDSLLLLE
jgi:hypothetical protein